MRLLWFIVCLRAESYLLQWVESALRLSFGMTYRRETVGPSRRFYTRAKKYLHVENT